MQNPLNSPTPEQKFSILTNQIRTPIEIIHGLALLMKRNVESNNAKSDNLLKDINGIVEAANQIKTLLDDLVSPP